MSPLTYVLRLLRWFKDRPGRAAILVACLVIEMGFNAWVPMAFSHLIDHAITPKNTAVLVNVLLALGGAVVLTTAAGLIGDFVYARLSSGVVARMRQQLFDHLQTLSPSFFQKFSAGDVTARYSTDLIAVESTLSTWIAWGWRPLLDLIGYNFVMFTVDWRLALFAQLLWPMTLLGPKIFAPRATEAAEQRKGRESDVLTAVDEATAGRNVVRAFGL
ncbi:MAG: hypothetical protein RLZZ15_2371, partial [Verrucomicrobiota bacterium]